MDLLEKKIFYYMRGRGIDTSRSPVLRNVASAEVLFLFKEPDNLYHFYSNEGTEYESFDFVFNDGLLNETKFYMILLKEWFYLLRPGGNLVVRFRESPAVNRDNIEGIVKSLLGDYGELLYVGNDALGRIIVIVQKLDSVLSYEDDINRWSFCIINAMGHDIEPLIESIEAQGIPEFETIVDDPRYDMDGRDHTRYLRPSMEVAAPKTQVLKNMMLCNVKYENTVIINRAKGALLLAPGWFEEIKRYGNFFEALSPAIVTDGGERYADWWTLGCNKKNLSTKILQRSSLGLLDYRDWDRWVYFSDPVCIMKKSLYRKALWDVFSIEGDENTHFSHQLYERGVLLRACPSVVFRISRADVSMLSRNFPAFEFNRLRLGDRKGKFLRRAAWLAMEIMFKIKMLERVLVPWAKYVKSTRMYRIFLR